MAVDHHPVPPTISASEQLLEDSWGARERRASLRELTVEVAAGLLFLAVAGGLLAVAGARGLSLPVAGLLVLVYGAVARVEFAVGAGHVVPTQLVLMPMLVVLPPAVVPLVVAFTLVVSTTFDYFQGATTARRIVSAVPDAWHALGGAALLVAVGSATAGTADLPVLAAAFAACCVVDLISSLLRMRLTGLVTDVRAPLGVIATVWAVDACLAPLGILAGLATESTTLAAVGVLPLAMLLRGLARDRSRRIAQAHARLKLVEHERSRLQSAVRRLGDAFAAKLELDALVRILLHGSVEALDAGGGRLELTGHPEPVELRVGDGAELGHVLSLPMRFDGPSVEVTGTLRLAREGRPFEEDEVELLRELVAKAEMAAADILSHQVLRVQALSDALTGLGNRRRLTADLAQALRQATPEEPALLLLFDLDGFKAYNDTFGHLAGDALLTRLGAKLGEAVAGHGAAYRLGGDEFCALCRFEEPELDDLIARAAAALAEQGGQFSIEASLGVVLLPHEVDSVDHALQIADQRMYANKRGRSTAPRDQARDVLLRTMQAKQPNLDEHSSEVGQLASRVARRLGLSGEDLDEIARAAELHDVGKVGIPDAILNKPSGLDEHEWEFIRQHTILGERILNAAPALRPVARLVRASHERWDGGGYPDGTAGTAIPLGARIISVCDAYEAMTANRTYRRAMADSFAVQQLRDGAGSQFDPTVVDAFLAVLHEDELDAGETGDRRCAEEAAAHVRALLT